MYFVDVDAYSLTSNLEEEICPGQDVVLTGSNYYENAQWFYDGTSLGYPGSINITKDVTVSGFTFSLSSLPPYYTSTLSFRADAAMNGHRVLCHTIIIILKSLHTCSYLKKVMYRATWPAIIN